VLIHYHLQIQEGHDLWYLNIHQRRMFHGHFITLCSSLGFEISMMFVKESEICHTI